MKRLNEQESSKYVFYEMTKTMLTAILIALIINSFIVNARVIGQSMNPTYEENDVLIINKMAYINNEYEFGDIIIFNNDNKGHKLIKRVIGLPNDKIEIKDGKVYRNDNLLNEPYIKDGYTPGDLRVIVPEGSLFVLGDNRTNSLDSRYESVGFVNYSDVIGKVFLRLFPNTGFVE